MSRRHCITLVLLLATAPAARAQGPDLESALEQWLDDGAPAATAEQMADLVQSLRETPLNINDTTDLRLIELGLMSPFQQRALCVYIMRYGALTTLGELYYVPGFDTMTVQRLSPLVTAAPQSGSVRPTWRRLAGYPKLHVLGGASATLPRNADGDPLRLYSRLRFDLGQHLQLQLSYDRDPAEGWLDSTNFYSGHIIVNNIGVLHKAIAGRYNLQFGQGLAVWTGFAPFVAAGVSPYRLARGIKPASAFAESGYLQGAAATFNIYKGFEATAFFSSVEHNKLAGAHLAYRRNGTNLGLTVAQTMLARTPAPRTTQYNYYALRQQNTLNISIDAATALHNVLLYAEAAADHHMHLAATAGAQLALSGNTYMGASARYYAVDYHAPYSSAPGVANGANEQALRLDFKTVMPTRTSVALMADMVHHPYLRYGAYSPTNAIDLRLNLTQPLGHGLEVTLRYRHRAKERNGVVEPQANYQTESTLRRQLQADLSYSSEPWRILGRVQCVWFECQQHAPLQGFMLFEEVAYRPTASRLRLAARATIFDTEGYDAAIYMAESDLAYNFSTPLLNGQGVRLSLVTGCNLGRGWDLSAKYALTVRPEGLAAHVVKVQLRLSV